MNWSSIIRAVNGNPAALKRMAGAEWSQDAALGAALLLLDDAPHPAAALVVAGIAALNGHGPPLAAALMPHVVSALSAWRSAPTWAERSIGDRTPYDLIHGVAHLIAALRDDPAALRDAVGIVARNGGWMSIDACLAALGGAGWGLLADAERGALWTRALRDHTAALGFVWPALSDAQREAAAQRAAAKVGPAAALIGGIGAAAWTTTDAALRRLLIDAAAQKPDTIPDSAPAWTGMSDAERARLVTAVVDDGKSWVAYYLLDALGAAVRLALSSLQRAALDRRGAQFDEGRTALLRLADAGWNALSDDVRRNLMEWAEISPPIAADFIRAVGIDVWRALPPDVQKRLRTTVQRAPSALLACPPALWVDIAGGRFLPSVSFVAPWSISQWRAEDASADLRALPPEHQASVLALAPWRAADCVPPSPRMARLLAVWNGMTADARVDLAMAHPWTLATVAVAARLTAREPGIAATSHQATATIVDALTGMVLRTDPAAAARATVGRMLAAQRCWRTWMLAFVPTDNDPPEAWDAWLAAARRSAFLDRGIVLRLMAHDAQRATRRRRRGRGGG